MTSLYRTERHEEPEMQSHTAREIARTMTREGGEYAGLTVSATRRFAVEDGHDAAVVEAIETELIESGRAAESFGLKSLTDAEIVADLYAADLKLTSRDVEISDAERREVAFEMRALRTEDRVRAARVRG